MNRTPQITQAAILLVVVVLPSCTTTNYSQRAKKPQGNRHSCNYCHTYADPTTNPELVVSQEQVALICVPCHEFGNRHYPLHHPFGFTPQRTDFVNPDKTFPLFDNMIECMTCHEPHGGADHSETPSLLRGGPYDDRRQICFRCHEKEVYSRIDPHQMKDDQGKIRVVSGRQACLYCHTTIPDPQTQRTVDVRFRADIGFICWRCHPPMPGEFFHNHFLKKPGKRTMKAMHNTERTADVILPIVPRNRVTCSTCHNPHQQGVIISTAAAKGADTKDKLRLSKQELCTACHGGK